mmetsp:Transcript_26686/g.31055  ORF Transcript_26686/g.31055 Transcript_26686/m.31055 type:complete len:182 (+) Transcript_26686:75-620(+)
MAPKSPFDAFLKKGKDDCDRPACDDTISALNQALSRIGNKKEAVASVGSRSSSRSSENDGILGYKACPPSKENIGRSTWTLLHSMAAWYPDRPSFEEERRIKAFMEALAIFYPCTYCATDFQENIKKTPVQTKSRKDLCVWLCEQHNNVNEKLGKQLFDCSIKNLDERWRKNQDRKCNGGE